MYGCARFSTWGSSTSWRTRRGLAYRLNPLGNIEIARLEVAASLFTGSYERAREQATGLLARGADAPVIRNYLGLAQFYAGDVAAARGTLAAVQRAGRPDVRSQAALAGVEAAAGERSAARAPERDIENGPLHGPPRRL